MSKVLAKLSMVLVGLFIAAGLAFGASEAVGAPGVMSCSHPDQIGTCPGEFTEESCDQECVARYGNGGFCLQGCCVCLV